MQSIDLKIAGLHTFESELSEAPPGSLSVADNIVINRPSVAEPRRGQDQLAGAFSDVSYRANKVFFYQSQVLAHYYNNLFAYNTGTAWSNYSGTYDPPSSTIKVRAVEANQNFYFTTAAGVKKLDRYNGTPVASGAPKGIDLQAALNSSSGWLTVNFRVAYRLVWGYYDTNKNLILGSPSPRESIKNTAIATRSIDLTGSVPQQIIDTYNAGTITGWIYQLYRSDMIDNSSSYIEPSEEMRLVYQGTISSTDISNKYISVSDIVDDSLRLGATIYTAASQEGLANQNEQPPLSKDVAVYKNTLFYGNTISRNRYNLTLLAIGGTGGIVNDDTITIGGITYTGKGTETVASAQFKVVTAGSAAQNIHDTAISLVRVINRYASSTVYAYYLSAAGDLPGKILLEERNIGGVSFAVVSSRATCWSPSLPTSGTTESSTADTFKNGIAYSKVSSPEAVPLGNNLFAGSANKNILRILALRDSLFILKEDGVYRVSGDSSSNFRVDLLDSTAVLIAPESAVVLNNQIYALTTQGVVTITETGVQVISRPIESTLLSLQGEDFTVLQNATFAVSYESERKYILFVLSQEGETIPSQAFVYNTFTNTWTRWPLSYTCGGVNAANDKAYFGDGLSNYVLIERKNFAYTDYVDFGFTTAITAVSGLTLTITGADNIAAGDVIYQSSSVFSTVESVDAVAGTVVVTVSAAFTVADCSVLKAITTKIAWVPFTAGNPGMLKHFREALILFKKDFTGIATIRFSSDRSLSQETETLTGTGIGLWGLFSWGSIPWGGENVKRPYRLLIPRNKQNCSQLTIQFEHSTGYANYQLNGISLICEMVSERVTR